LEAFPVEELESTLEDFLATEELVVFLDIIPPVDYEILGLLMLLAVSIWSPSHFQPK
jgi:hypothetical protein